jgi:hypothetical protein
MIGCEYLSDPKNILKSSINDINKIIDLLITNFNYKNENIYLLKNYKKKNIINFLNLIQKKINPGDIIFLYFTGHGTNNAVITEDYKLLYNFEIKNNFINKLPKDAKLFGLIDACYSENELNLPFYYFKYKWSKEIKFNKPLCNAIMISACMKNEVTWTVLNNSFITNLFITIIKENNNITWYDLIFKINSNILENGYEQTSILSSSEIINLRNLISSFI